MENPGETQHLHSMLSRGISLIWKLSDPSYSAAEVYIESDAAWSARMISIAPDPDQFQAGRMHAHVAILDAFFAQTSTNSAISRKIQTWVRHGIKLPSVGVGHKSHAHAAHYDSNLEVVKRMLSRAVGAPNISPYLQGSKPSPVQLQNLKAV